VLRRAKAYRTPFVSGKDSLNNQFTTEDGRTIRDPAHAADHRHRDRARMHCITMDLKRPDSVLIMVGQSSTACGGSHVRLQHPDAVNADLPHIDPAVHARTARTVHELIRTNLVHAAHDVSDGGLLCAIAEMCIAGNLGVLLDGLTGDFDMLFSEAPGRYILEVAPDQLDAIAAVLGDVPMLKLGTLQNNATLSLPAANLQCDVASLHDAWTRTLDW
jgi:phosphoribosylformylglycinamidine (FGAM) synthase-like enzyme